MISCFGVFKNSTLLGDNKMVSKILRNLWICLFGLILVCNSSSIFAYQRVKTIDIPVSLLPINQKDFLDKITDLTNRSNDNHKIKNAIVKKEANDVLRIDEKTFLTQINKSIKKRDLDRWLGQITISSNSIYISVSSNGRKYFSFDFYTKGMNKEILEVVKKLNSDDVVSFSVSPLNKDLFKYYSLPLRGPEKLPGELLNFLEPFSGK